MRYPNREEVKMVREKFPSGTRVELDYMDDAQAPDIGTRGTVIHVDDVATIHVRWDNGSGLGVAYGADKCHVVREND